MLLKELIVLVRSCLGKGCSSGIPKYQQRNSAPVIWCTLLVML